VPVPTATLAVQPPPPAAPVPSPVAIDPPRAPDPASVYVEIGPASTTVGATVTNVGKALAPLAGKFTGCYRAAVGQVNVGSAPATLHVETDENGVITDARVDPRVGPAVRACIAGAARGRKIPNVDTGSASADVPLWFKSR
jgi:hypothetical protein